MITDSMFDLGTSGKGIEPGTSMHRYAWLEHEGGMWHFLTNLFADPRKSTRRWLDKQRALEELTGEGWTVVYPYRDPFMNQVSSDNACGYGLMWVDH